MSLYEAVIRPQKLYRVCGFMYYLFWNLEKTYEVKKRVIFIFDCNCTISDCHLWTIYIFVQKFLVNNIILNSVCVYI